MKEKSYIARFDTNYLVSSILILLTVLDNSVRSTQDKEAHLGRTTNRKDKTGGPQLYSS